MRSLLKVIAGVTPLTLGLSMMPVDQASATVLKLDFAGMASTNHQGVILVGHTEQQEENRQRERRQQKAQIEDDRYWWEKIGKPYHEHKSYWKDRYKREGGQNRGQDRNNNADNNYGAPGDGIY
ncbi:MAG: hypothetical protein GDA50_07325 [Alphaproteobacteria bacterium GM202ARS2]|nr:hypothetical protein [Alphaproteobacteria bacterium GM202ARS2]